MPEAAVAHLVAVAEGDTVLQLPRAVGREAVSLVVAHQTPTRRTISTKEAMVAAADGLVDAIGTETRALSLAERGLAPSRAPQEEDEDVAVGCSAVAEVVGVMVAADMATTASQSLLFTRIVKAF